MLHILHLISSCWVHRSEIKLPVASVEALKNQRRELRYLWALNVLVFFSRTVSAVKKVKPETLHLPHFNQPQPSKTAAPLFVPERFFFFNWADKRSCIHCLCCLNEVFTTTVLQLQVLLTHWWVYHLVMFNWESKFGKLKIKIITLLSIIYESNAKQNKNKQNIIIMACFSYLDVILLSNKKTSMDWIWFSYVMCPICVTRRLLTSLLLLIT